MPSTLTAITTAIQTAANVLMVSPQSTIGYQPQGSGALIPPPALIFHYEGEQSVELKSNITDHFVEDNTAVQNNIALPPPIVTTQGFIGELNDVPPNKFFEVSRTLANKLVTIAGYAPTLSATALIAYNEAFAAYQTAASLVNSAVSAYSTLTGVGGESVIDGTGQLTTQPNQTKQQQYFQQFYGYWRERRLFTVQTPWAVFTDMAIESLRPVQSAETNMITDFEIRFKQIRKASSLTTSSLYGDPNQFNGRLQYQAAPTVNLGTSALTPSTTSINQAIV